MVRRISTKLLLAVLGAVVIPFLGFALYADAAAAVQLLHLHLGGRQFCSQGTHEPVIEILCRQEVTLVVPAGQAIAQMRHALLQHRAGHGHGDTPQPRRQADQQFRTIRQKNRIDHHGRRGHLFQSGALQTGRIQDVDGCRQKTALRAIVNRCTAHQERHRYRSSRTLLRALEGWRQAQALEAGGPLALLMDRLQSVGHLPAQPGLAARITAITSVEGQHAEEIAEQVLQDIALSLELVRSSNSVQVRGSMESGAGPVLAIRRGIALLGVDGVRCAANSLRLWPGPLRPEHAEVMQRQLDRVRLAGYAGQALRPAGYDAEVVFLIVVLQNLGRLLVHYHFPEEAEQIELLMQPSTAAATASGGEPVQLPGMTENVAANAVLGVDFDALRNAVIRHWGLGEDVVKMVRPLPQEKGVRAADSDADSLRATASAANELAQAGGIEPPQRRSGVPAPPVESRLPPRTAEPFEAAPPRASSVRPVPAKTKQRKSRRVRRPSKSAGGDGGE